MNTQESVEVFREINTFAKKVNRWATLLQTLTVLLTLMIVTTSVMIGFLAGEIDAIWIKVMAVVTTFSTVSMSALSLEKKAYDFRKAYRHLNYAIFLYRTGKYDIHNLVNAYHETEEMIGHVEVNEDVISNLVDVRKTTK